jgi:hypothetical protein
VRFYLIQQEGSAVPPLTAAEVDLNYFRQIHGQRNLAVSYETLGWKGALETIDTTFLWK